MKMEMTLEAPHDGTVVEVMIKLLTNRGRPIAYHDLRTADEQGRFALTVPYWTEKRLAPEVTRYVQNLKNRKRNRKKPKALDIEQTIAVGPALLSTKDRTLKVHIPRDAVLSGRALPIVFPPVSPPEQHNGP